MTDELLLHPDTSRQLARLLAKPPHALLITGLNGIGKASLARLIVANLTGIDKAELASSGALLEIAPEDKGTISIDEIRRINSFMSLKTLGKRNEIRRAVIIQDAVSMGQAAQNALLKVLEEPPADSLIILTASALADLLPTIVSRCQVFAIHKPDRESLSAFLATSHADKEQVAWAINLSGGLPGLAVSLLDDSRVHPLKIATDQAKQLLAEPAYERLKRIDVLAKDRQACLDLCQILQHMAHLAIPRAVGSSADRWQRILSSAYTSAEALESNANIRLCLVKLMLEL